MWVVSGIITLSPKKCMFENTYRKFVLQSIFFYLIITYTDVCCTSCLLCNNLICYATQIPSLQELHRVSSKIEKLWVEGNPLCENLDPVTYVKQITMKFPRLTQLVSVNCLFTIFLTKCSIESIYKVLKEIWLSYGRYMYMVKMMREHSMLKNKLIIWWKYFNLFMCIDSDLPENNWLCILNLLNKKIHK